MRSKDQNKEDRKSLKYQVGLSLRRYFKELDGNKATNVFEMVIKEVEKPMLEEVMKYKKINDRSKAVVDLIEKEYDRI